MTRRTISLLLLSALLAGCSRPDQNKENAQGDAGQPVKGDWAVVRYEADPDTLNALMSVTATGHYAGWGINNSQIYELLMGYNTKDWALTAPLLAEALPTISDDHLIYTFKIRSGVKWHDGQAFTPDDVLFTFKATACPLVDAAPLRSFMTDLIDVQVEGQNVRFTVSQPNVYNVSNLANLLPIVAKHVYDPEGLLDGFTFKDMIGPRGKTDPRVKKFAEAFASNPANRAPVGTGPYKFEKWESGREIVLARNDNYWGKKPYLDKIVFRIIPDPAAALVALKAGEIDMQPRLLPIQFAQETNGPAFEQQYTKVKYSIPAEFEIMWNNERPFFKDKRVRQAMTMLIDRQKIIDSIRLGLGTIGVTPLDPRIKDFNTTIKPWPYDPQRAMQLLDEAGWTDHNGDGIRDKDGVKFKFEFLGSTGSSVFKQLAPVLADSFKKAGIEMTDRVVEFALMTQTLKEHKFDSSVIGFTYDLVQDPWQVWHSKGGSNYVSFKHPEADGLLDQARLEFDAEKRKQIYWRWQEIIQDEQPVTFLYYLQDPAAYSKRFQSVQWLPPRPGYDLNSWWVPAAQQKYKSAATP